MSEEFWKPEESFGDRLRMCRMRLKLQVVELAAKLDVSHQALSDWERGSSPKNLDEIVAKMARIYGIDPIWLMWGNNTFGDERFEEALRRDAGNPEASFLSYQDLIVA
jgi:transcriptional regulator with XRE-family HTH domain